MVGAALEYAEDPLEVCKWDVLHVLRKNKRFLARVKMTHDHLESFKRSKNDSKSLGVCGQEDEKLNVLVTATFDVDDSTPAASDAAARPDFSDAAREQADDTSAVTRTISFKLRKPAE